MASSALVMRLGQRSESARRLPLIGLGSGTLGIEATPGSRCQWIVAPKGAGSSPVGHPSTSSIGKPNRRKSKESRYKHRGLLTPLWHHSGEVREVQGRQLGPQNWYDVSHSIASGV